jgi:hypothetical protein
MKHLLIAVLAGLALLSPLANGFVQAQYGTYQTPQYGPGYRPLLNPYLNLFRGRNINGPNAIDYYLGTVTEAQRRQNAFEFRSDIGDLDRRTRTLPEGLPEPGPIVSGTPVVLGTTGQYFNNTFPYYQPLTRRPTTTGTGPQPGQSSRGSTSGRTPPPPAGIGAPTSGRPISPGYGY